jgi:hypothetical protein
MTLASAENQIGARRFVVGVRWLPAVTAAAYLATVATFGSQLVRRLGWDTDSSGPLALAERLRGHGPVYLPHFGAWTSYWWLLATRGMPGHSAIWEATGYVFAVAGAALLAWATGRVAGRWAGLTAGAVALVVGPYTLRALMSVIYHVTNPFTAIVLAAYLVLLQRTRSWPLAVAVGLLAGANAASDPLLWFAGIAPFAFAAALYARLTRSPAVALHAGATVGVCVVAAVATNLSMHSVGFQVVGLDVRLAPLHDMPANALHLGRMAALLGGANYAFAPGYPREPLRALLAVIVLAAVAAPVVAAVKLTVRRADAAVRVYASYWAAAAILLCVLLVVTPNARALGPDSAFYVLTLAPAAGVGVVLLAADSGRRQLVVALAVAIVGATNIAGIPDRVAGTPAIGMYQRPLQRLLDQHGVRRGYAGYWDAQNLSWESGMHLLVAPVSWCTATKLCPYNFFTIHSWYEPQPGPTFLLLDATNGVITEAPPFVTRATGSYRFGPLTVYLFDYDIARHIRNGAQQ